MIRRNSRAASRRRTAWLLAVRLLLTAVIAGGLWRAALNAQEPTGPTPAPTPPNAAVERADDGLIATKNLLQMFQEGGPLMWPILGCSFVTVVYLAERAIALRRARVAPGPFVQRFLKQLQDGELDRAKAIELCEKHRSAISDVFKAAVRKWGKPAVEVEQAVLDAGERAANALRRHLRVFNGVSTIAPLLGLLGTVLGMIDCFNTISAADAMGRAELLAGGIGEAMLTTASGLCVAIPALVIYLYLTGRVDRLVMEMDALGQEVVNRISAEALAEQQPAASRGARSRREAA